MTTEEAQSSLMANAQTFGRGGLNIPAVLILIFAAVVKTFQLANSPWVENSIFESKLASLSLVCFELFLAALLVAGIRDGMVRGFSVVVFLAFSVINGYIWISGGPSCGCFGDISVSPLVMIVVDIGIAASLYFWIPTWRLPFAACMGFACVACAACVIWGNSFRFEKLDKASVDSNSIVVLSKDSLVGNNIQLLEKFLESGADEIQVGVWQIIFVHGNCSKCDELIRETLGSPIPTAYIVLPPFSAIDMQESELKRYYCLQEDVTWFAKTPIRLLLVDGDFHEFNK